MSSYHREHGPARRDEGMALILALLFIVLLSVLVVNFSYDGQLEASFAENRGNDLQARLAAKSAVAQGLALLAADLLPDNSDPQYDLTVLDTALDVWYAGHPFDPINEDAYMRATIDDEYGKINLNALLDYSQSPPVEREALVEALRAFFLDRAPDAEDPVDAILDWLDYGDEDDERPGGAENDFYEASEIPYPCKNAQMDTIEELLLIKGITPDIYWGDPERDQLPLSEYLTVHGDWQGRVNANTAREEVLAAVVGAYDGSGFNFTAGEDIYIRTHEEQPFGNVGELADYVGPGPGRDQDRTRNRNRARDPDAPPPPSQRAFRVNSNVFRIRGDGLAGENMVRIEAYVWRTPLETGGAVPDFPAGTEAPAEPFRILEWRVIR